MLKRGEWIAHYEILEPIGVGGTGEVYRARDTELEREVAVKVLRDIANDQELIVRLEREAKVLASLNHPNIASIFGVESFGQARALVLELVEGPTLADRISRGRIPLEEALPIALQIIAALEAAHVRGVVHRDLKPANIKLTAQGQVKVLDFGLAKAFRGDESGIDGSNSPTLTKDTANGVILGTAAYMSPEQARGKPVDKRADIWAFGVVFNEMLSGKRLFTGETVSDVIAAVLTREPAVPSVPANVATVLRRCLRKDPRERLHDIADARLELMESRSARVSGSPQRRNWGWLAAGVMTLLLAASVSLRLRRGAPEMRLDIDVPPTTDLISIAIAPDGRAVTFVANMDDVARLWFRSLGKSDVRSLDGTEGASYPFWSPDSNEIGFFADGELKRIDLSTGDVLTVASAPYARGGAWGPGGEILFAPETIGALMMTSVDGRDPVPVTTLDPSLQNLTHRRPQFLPDGRHFLLRATNGVFVGSLNDENRAIRRVPIDSDTDAAFGAGYLFFVRRGTLWAQAFDPDRLTVRGDPVPVAHGVTWDMDRNVAAISVSNDGTLLYRAGAMEQRQLLWYDRSGAVLEAIGSPDAATPWDVQLSSDDSRVLTRRSPEGLNPDIWVIEAGRGVASRLTFHEDIEVWPVWSPDGRDIVFASTRNGTHDLFKKPSNGNGSAELLFRSSVPNVPSDWSADGRFLIFHHRAERADTDLWALPLMDGDEPFPLASTPFFERHGQVSPDGKWLALTSDQTGREEIYVQAFSEPGTRWQISVDGGSYPRWRPDTREIFYLGRSGEIVAAAFTELDSGSIEVGDAETLFRVMNIVGGGSGGGQSHQYDVSRDGERFLINTIVSAPSGPMTLVLNWSPKAPGN